MLYLADAIQLFAAALIGLAALQATLRSLTIFFRRGFSESATEDVRLRLGRWLVLALEFQVAADILRTAVAPTWTEIGQLAAIIILRTVLNYFLQKEIEKAAYTENANQGSPAPALPNHRQGPDRPPPAGIPAGAGTEPGT
ncbi:MAG: DUF1622 domain-containing protein [Gemmataceae bacterium]|nr:DUF1622 domain-containing protein [Gemmataceae bacterium]